MNALILSCARSAGAGILSLPRESSLSFGSDAGGGASFWFSGTAQGRNSLVVKGGGMEGVVIRYLGLPKGRSRGQDWWGSSMKLRFSIMFRSV